MIRRILPLSILSAALAICLAGVSTAKAADEKGSVSGKVTTATGEVAKATGDNPTAKVYVMKAEDAPAPASRPAGGGGGGGGRRGPDTSKAVASGDITDGAYKIADVPVGKYVLIVRVSGVGNGRAEIEVTAGKDTATDVKLMARPARQPRNGGGGGAAPQ
jgi:hypothetical protein